MRASILITGTISLTAILMFAQAHSMELYLMDQDGVFRSAKEVEEHNWQLEEEQPEELPLYEAFQANIYIIQGKRFNGKLDYLGLDSSEILLLKI